MSENPSGTSLGFGDENQTRSSNLNQDNDVIIFHLWKQRNNVIHNQISLSTAAVFRLVDRDVRTIITAKRQRKNFTSLACRVGCDN
ncbi:hypothetical protein F2Q70_00016016 [Brassica cretica]|uniref:Uncharacterized protein n=1 Tax=Brassica cretica TaxID=69181 RepID=A0A8S9I2D2_BRACR|nr:hypothetical protein F2Q70_00016016 [Brassica cretica]